ncbi:hypothetical protein ACJQWK_09254 [Exserohilum turcicum]
MLLLFNGGAMPTVDSAKWPKFGSSETTHETKHGTIHTGLATDIANDLDDNETNAESAPEGSFFTDSAKPSSPVESTHATAASTSPQHTPTLAFATFLTGQATDDTYFNLTRTLAYQFLQAPDTRILNPDITFIVLCGRKLPESKREILRKDGATVIGVEDVPVPSWIQTVVPRWSEQFTKLRVFQQTQYKRILYMDADYLLMKRMDDIFNESIVRQLTPTLFDRKDQIPEDEEPLPAEWLFSARSENGMTGSFDHFVPPLPTVTANAGFFLIAPQQSLFDYFMRVMQLEGRFRTTFMEQDMLNYVFRREGPMPWRELDWKWSANFANQRDVDNGVHALHGKFWAEGPQAVRDRWRNIMDQMEW